MRAVALLGLIVLLSGCRLLPPLPGCPDDEAFIAHLQTLDWRSERLPRHFDQEAVTEWFGEGIVPESLYKIQPRDEYLRWQPRESIGVRRIFRFYASETDPVTGVSVFTHEFAHAANWIDIFDMPYNEFLSHTLECYQAQLAAKQDPDLGVQLLNRALVLWRPRDIHYEDESHMRARLWIGALLEEMDPLEIYRWARDCSKSEFHERIDRAMGDKPRDVVRRGVTAFARRHFPGDYLPTLLRVRDKKDHEQRLRIFTELLETMPADHVFRDNVQWQRLSSLNRLDRHAEALTLADELWSGSRKALIGEGIAEIGFAAACVTGDAAARATWDERNRGLARWDGAALDWKLRRLQLLYVQDLVGGIAALKEFEGIRGDAYWPHRPALHEPAGAWVDDVLEVELSRLTGQWQTSEPGEDAETRIEVLAGYTARFGGAGAVARLRTARNTLLSRRADQAWELGEFDKAARLYREAGDGRHHRETRYWRERRD